MSTWIPGRPTFLKTNLFHVTRTLHQISELQPAAAAIFVAVTSKPVRLALPDHLPRETETHSPAQDSCPTCGGTFRKLGEDVEAGGHNPDTCLCSRGETGLPVGVIPAFSNIRITVRSIRVRCIAPLAQQTSAEAKALRCDLRGRSPSDHLQRKRTRRLARDGAGDTLLE